MQRWCLLQQVRKINGLLTKSLLELKLFRVILWSGEVALRCSNSRINLHKLPIGFLPGPHKGLPMVHHAPLTSYPDFTLWCQCWAFSDCKGFVRVILHSNPTSTPHSTFYVLIRCHLLSHLILMRTVSHCRCEEARCHDKLLISDGLRMRTGWQVDSNGCHHGGWWSWEWKADEADESFKTRGL